ncbi:TetR family transcriptional regulator [Halomonas sp. BC04]|uniref:TetR family transcriptional regulator n=1 Tax=Halomonas sp. BC04 TaxID=1403540 RepID=UPI0003ED60C1|nr:hypothetical protein Q427_03845 [Halomonas sp. BC04]
MASLESTGCAALSKTYLDRSVYIGEGTHASIQARSLLTTAERLFYEQGFHATGIDRIVAAVVAVR